MHLDPFQLYWLQVARWLWCGCFRVSSRCGFLDAFTERNQSTILTEYTNAFNQTESNVTSTSDSGNTSLTLGGGVGGAGDLSGLAGIVIAILGAVAGLFLITRSK